MESNPVQQVFERADALVNPASSPFIEIVNNPWWYTPLLLATGIVLGVIMSWIVLFIYSRDGTRDKLLPNFSRVMKLPVLLIEDMYHRLPTDRSEVKPSVEDSIMMGLTAIAVCIFGGLVLSGAFNVIAVIMTVSMSLLGA